MKERERQEVEEDEHNVLLHALDGRELMRNAVDLDRRDRCARKRGKHDSAEGVAESVAIARSEPVDLVHALLAVFGDDARL